MLDRRHRHPMEADDDLELPSLAQLCATLLDVGFRQTDALLLVLGRMTGDELLAKGIHREVAERKHRIPGWVLRLDELRPTRAVEMSHVLRDGDNVALEVHLPGNRQCTVKKVPDLLRAFVRYCHDKRGIARELTAQTIREIDDDESAYRQAITAPHRHGAEAPWNGSAR